MNHEPKPPYHSFLLCFHPEQTDCYFNGRPLGQIKDGVFRPATVARPGQNPRPLAFTDIIGPNPYQDMGELKHAVLEALAAIQLADKPGVAS